MTDTRRRMAKGAFWMLSFRLVDRSIGLVSTLFLARLLVPGDFGLIAMAMSIFAALEILSSFSFDVALIQNPNAERRHYDTAWTFNVLLGLVNSVAMLVLAGPAAAFFVEPRVEGIMMCLAIYAALQGFGNIGVVAFDKDLDLHKAFILGVIRKLVGFAVTMTIAFQLRTYWALVAGMLATALAGVVLSYWMHPYRPRFCLSARRELFRFSKWLLVNNVLVFLVHRSTDWVIGRVAGASALGLYSVAYEISNLPTTELVAPISRAVFPGYAKMAGSLEELRRGFLEVLSVILLFAVPAGVGICLLAEPMVYAVLGEKWKEAIPLVQVLGLYGILRASVSNTGAIYLVLGIPKVTTYLTLFFLAIVFPAFWFWVPKYGAMGAAYAIFLAACLQVPVGFYVVLSKLELRLPVFLSVFWRPLAGAGLMAVIVTLVHSYPALNQLGWFIQLAVLVPVGAVIYVTTVLSLWAVSGRSRGGETMLISAAQMLLAKLMKRGTSPA